MIRVCFVCLGNICRSPMAEFIMKDKVNNLGLNDYFLIESRGTSSEEEGNDIYLPAKRMLDSRGISYTKHCARKLEEADIDKFDYFICMEKNNLRGVSYIFDDLDKVFMLLDKDITDPWYSGDFSKTYNDLDLGIDLLIERLRKQI